MLVKLIFILSCTLQEREWQLLTLALLRALAIERLPALQEQFDGRRGVRSLNELLADAGLTVEEFDALLEVLLPSQCENRRAQGAHKAISASYKRSSKW
jgi:hypothetical protein